MKNTPEPLPLCDPRRWGGVYWALVSVLFFPAVIHSQSTQAEARLRSWEEHLLLEEESPFGALEWRAVGPMQAGARVEAISVPPGNHGTIYVGIGSGNLWKTENNGLTWTPIFEKESAFSIGDVAVSASNPEIVWIGT